MTDDDHLTFTSELLDTCPGGITIERPGPAQSYDVTGRLGSVVTVTGRGRFALIEQLPSGDWLGQRLADPR
jgi:hypothetical protein